jgi:hypothetical protein
MPVDSSFEQKKPPEGGLEEKNNQERSIWISMVPPHFCGSTHWYPNEGLMTFINDVS